MTALCNFYKDVKSVLQSGENTWKENKTFLIWCLLSYRPSHEHFTLLLRIIFSNGTLFHEVIFLPI
jgi:hypothetical protein